VGEDLPFLMPFVDSALGRLCILNQHPFREVQAKRAIGRHMAIDERGQRAQVLLFHLLQLPGLGEHLLDEQRIDILSRDSGGHLFYCLSVALWSLEPTCHL
jgi:hypothetical protein